MIMTSNNIGKLFFKEYYEGVDFGFALSDKPADSDSIAKVKDVNNTIKQSQLIPIDRPIEGLHTFTATILYPGLITGVGLVHYSKGIAGGYNLGMHFDYTTGMPIVYGSSVKGVLSSFFEEFYDGEMDKKKLADAIFKGKDPNARDGYLPVYQRDVFFNAVITAVHKHKTSNGQSNQQFLVDDSITPHTGGPLKNPNPIAMLKIAAGCTIEFRFLLRDTTIGNMTFRANEKLNLFKRILGTVGVGAKTNVGYGQLKINQ